MVKTFLSLLVGLSALSPLQAQTIVYENDFENPATTVCDRFNGSWGDSRLASDYSRTGFEFIQIGSADRLCIKPAANATSTYTDPEGAGGKYAVGFHGGDTSPLSLESFGMLYDIGNSAVLDGSFISSPMGVPTLSQYDFNVGETVNFSVSFYEVPESASFSDIRLVGNGFGQNVIVQLSNQPLTPFDARNFSSVNTRGLWEFDWTPQSFSIDTRSLQANSRVFMLFSGLPHQRYMAFDKLRITRSGQAQPAGQMAVPASSGGALAALGLAIALGFVVVARKAARRGS